VRLLTLGNDDFALVFDDVDDTYRITHKGRTIRKTDAASSIAQDWNSLVDDVYHVTEQELLSKLGSNYAVDVSKEDLRSMALGQTLRVKPLLSDPNMQHLGEDSAEELAYKPRLKPMKKFRGKELVDFQREYKKDRIERLRENKIWRRKNKNALKRREKMRHYKKRN